MEYRRSFARVALAGVVGIASLLGQPPPATATGFTDTASSPFRADIDWLAGQRITRGCTSTRFCPDDAVTRGQMASFLVRFLNLPPYAGDRLFDDIDGSSHADSIDRLAASGITAGCGARRFCATRTVTREQMASFLVRALDLRHGAASDFFNDDDASGHRADIDRLAAISITSGCTSTRFCPSAAVTRGQMAAFIRRAAALRDAAAAGHRQTTAPGATVLLPVGLVVGRPVAADDPADPTIIEAVVLRPERVAVSERAVLAGQPHHRIAAGSLSGAWVATFGDRVLRSGAPLPACTIGDVATPHADYASWARTLLDLTFLLPEGYRPADLVPATDAGVDYDRSRGVPYVRQILIGDLSAMRADSRAAGLHLRVNSAFRSYETQLAELEGEIAWFESAVRSKGWDEAIRYTNRPGHSEHQLGTTMDIEPYVFPGVHAWLTANAWKYGFVLSYPEGRNSKHCYATEIWHYRYFGREVASAIRASGLSPREWLWYVHHQ